MTLLKMDEMEKMEYHVTQLMQLSGGDMSSEMNMPF